MLGYEYNPQAPYASLYKYDCRRHDNSVYEYEQKPILNKDYEAKRKPIQGYAGKNEAKPPLAQEFGCKTILVYKPVQEPPFSPTLAGQKSKLNPTDGQERLALTAKNPEC